MQQRNSVRWTWKVSAIAAAILLGGGTMYSIARAAKPMVTGQLRAHPRLQSSSPGEPSVEGTGEDPIQPGSIQCCLNTADEQGCSDLLPAECTAAGGLNLGPGACGEPDPCQPAGSFTENVESTPSGMRGGLMLRVHKLSPNATFGVNVGSARIGTLKTNRVGSGMAVFRTQLRGNRRSGAVKGLTVDPRGKLVTLTDTGENEILEGQISDPTTPGATQCCLDTHGPTGDQQGCDSLLPAECVAAGGIDMGPGTCEPDPCPNTGPNDGTNDGPDTQD